MRTLSLAVIALIGSSSAHHHHHHKPHHRSNVQFVDADMDDDAVTAQSIAESEREHGAKMAVLDEDHYKAAIKADSNLKFNGDDFQHSDRVENSLHRNLLIGTGFLNMEVPRSYPGVTMISSAAQLESDPIHGSLGPPKVDINDLDGAAAFEEKQRRMPPATFKDDEDVTTTTNSIKEAEKITKGKMEEPFDPLVQAKIAPTVKYTLADSDDEEEDTVETRRSVKTAEKYFKKRFFINKGERVAFEKGLSDGTIDPSVATFSEGKDTGITANPEEEAAKEAGKKAAAVKADAEAAKKAADPAAAKEDAAAAEADDAKAQALDLPPELNPALGLMQVKHADYNHQFADIN